MKLQTLERRSRQYPCRLTFRHAFGISRKRNKEIREVEKSMTCEQKSKILMGSLLQSI
jgi:hypothetical protein